MTNIRTLAKIAGVSASSVSRVLTGHANVRPETRERIVKAINDTNYQTPQSQEHERLCVGIVMPKLSANNIGGHPAFYAATTTFIEEMSKEKITNEIIVFDDHQLASPETLFSPLKNGYFILGTSEPQEDAILAFMKRRQIPYIILNRWVNDNFTNYVNIDDSLAAYNATLYLLSNGHRKIAFVGGNENFRNSKLRIKGYTKALQDNDISVRQEFVFQGLYTERFGYQFAESFMCLAEKPTAVLFSSDMIAIGFMNHIREYGLSIPKDLSIIGWGDFPSSSYVLPPLTTVHIPNAELGLQAAKMLVNLITTKDLTLLQAVMNASLTVRDSVATLTT